jgi:hypothetical protein
MAAVWYWPVEEAAMQLQGADVVLSGAAFCDQFVPNVVSSTDGLEVIWVDPSLYTMEFALFVSVVIVEPTMVEKVI